MPLICIQKKFPQSVSLMYVNRSVYCGSEHKNNKMNEEALPSRTAGILEGHGFDSRWGTLKFIFMSKKAFSSVYFTLSHHFTYY